MAAGHGFRARFSSVARTGRDRGRRPVVARCTDGHSLDPSRRRRGDLALSGGVRARVDAHCRLRALRRDIGGLARYSGEPWRRQCDADFAAAGRGCAQRRRGRSVGHDGNDKLRPFPHRPHLPMTTLAWQHTSSRFAQFLALTKPRVVSLIVFCAVIGMFLAVPFGVLDLRLAAVALAATIGIALVAGAAAAINCLVEQKIDALMSGTRGRPLPRGDLTPLQTLVFALVVGGSGLALLYFKVNELTMWLTLATFVGYAIVYRVILQPMTPQNIVIGGASGAMPPVLGWA